VETTIFDNVLFLLQIAIFAFLIIFGLKRGGALGCGVFSLLGIFIMIFIFGLPPGSAPINAVQIILAIAIAGGTLQAAGGMDYLVELAARIIRRFPSAVTFVAPAVTFLFVFGVGTANMTLSLEPVIAQTAMRAKVRPERPLIAAVTTANLALLCSPAGAAVAYVVSLLTVYGITLGKYLSIVLPAALISMLCVSIYLTVIGRRILSDEEFMKKYEKLADIEVPEAEEFSTQTKLSVVVFLSAVVAILLLGILPSLPGSVGEAVTNFLTFEIAGEPARLETHVVVMLLMFTSAAVNFLITDVTPKKIFRADVTSSTFAALFAVIGPGWLGSTIFTAPTNKAIIDSTVGDLISNYMWLMVFVVGIVALLVMSQSGTSAIVFPLALSLGATPLFIISIVQAVNTVFVIPAQPTLLFAIELDKTGGTKHSKFFIPGFISIGVAIAVSLVIVTLFHGGLPF